MVMSDRHGGHWTAGPNFPQHRGDHGPGGGKKPFGRWARQYDRCVDCGTDERRHAGHGLCCNCYQNARNAALGHVRLPVGRPRKSEQGARP